MMDCRVKPGNDGVVGEAGAPPPYSAPASCGVN